MSSNPTLVEFFTQDHRACDKRWVEVENAAEGGDPAAIQASWEAFDRAQRHHLEMEEGVLFPAFEDATGMTGGPTQVMRMEHEQMRGLLDQMASAMTGGDVQELIDLGDTLLMLIQQHNQKEEGMLYPMAERALASNWEDIRARLEN
jgi:hemerythrin-like domain-containing protein